MKQEEVEHLRFAYRRLTQVLDPKSSLEYLNVFKKIIDVQDLIINSNKKLELSSIIISQDFVDVYLLNNKIARFLILNIDKSQHDDLIREVQFAFSIFTGAEIENYLKTGGFDFSLNKVFDIGKEITEYLILKDGVKSTRKRDTPPDFPQIKTKEINTKHIRI